MITLKDTTESLVVTLGGANKHDYVAEYIDYKFGALDTGKAGSETSTYAVATANRTVVSAPPADTTRVIKNIFVRNTTANSTTNAFEKVSGGTDYALLTITLASGQSVVWGEDGRVQVYNATGEPKAAA